MIHYVNLNQASELDAFVAGHPRGNFMQSSLWGRVKRDWPWIGLILRDETGAIRGTLALLRHDLRQLRGCFFYGPRGPIASDAWAFSALVRAAAAYARVKGGCLLRLDPEVPEEDAAFRAQVKRLGFRVNQATDFSLFQPRLCYLSDLRGKDLASLEASYHRSTRGNVHKALRGPLRVRLGNGEDLTAFCRMMAKTGAKNGFTPRPQSYFRAFLEGLGPHAKLYLAELNEKPVAGAIAVYFGGTGSFCYGCSEEAGDKLHANELLQWQMQTEALALGCQRFDFRGVEGPAVETNPHYGLHRYKRGFGASLQAYVGQLDLPLRPWKYWLMTALVKLREGIV